MRSPGRSSNRSGGGSPRPSLPSLVVLSGDDVVTPFMKKRYNPEDMKAPAYVFGKPGRKREDETDSIKRQQLEEEERKRKEEEDRKRRLVSEDATMKRE